MSTGSARKTAFAKPRRSDTAPTPGPARAGPSGFIPTQITKAFTWSTSVATPAPDAVQWALNTSALIRDNYDDIYPKLLEKQQQRRLDKVPKYSLDQIDAKMKALVSKSWSTQADAEFKKYKASLDLWDMLAGEVFEKEHAKFLAQYAAMVRLRAERARLGRVGTF